MSVIVNIYFDTRLFRKKTNDYPYKLRVYHAGKSKLFPTVLGLSKEDHDMLAVKNLGTRLQQIRDKLAEIERSATNLKSRKSRAVVIDKSDRVNITDFF